MFLVNFTTKITFVPTIMFIFAFNYPNNSFLMDLYSLFLKHPHISTDSRVCKPDSIFFALKGDSFNANAFALSALEKGCAYAVVDEAEYAIDKRFVLVDNVLKSLQNLARRHRQMLETPIIGITGTNGKTTTKELIATVLKKKYNVLYTQGNLNNHIGVPLTLLKLTKVDDIAVVEMGANHRGEIALLASIAMPDYGIITNVGKAHLEGFGSFQGVMETKAELYEYISKNGKKVFLNIDNPYLVEMGNKAGLTDEKIERYSLKNTSVTVSGWVESCSPLLKMKSEIGEETIEIQTQLIGAYNAENVLAAASIGRFFDVKTADIANALETYTPNNNRSQFVVTKKNKLIIDAYNANPSSMSEAVRNFAQIEADNKTLILGDMLELGGQSAEEHQNIVELLQSNRFLNVILVGSQFINTKNNFVKFRNTDELFDYLKEKTIRNQYVLIKGSRGIKLEKVIELL